MVGNDISSLSVYPDKIGDFEAKTIYAVTRQDWIDYVSHDPEISGIFLDHDTARAFLEQIAKNYSIGLADHEELEILWDKDSNCDDGISIIYTDEGIEWCNDYAIQEAPLWYKP